jgi:hypothetical protein
MEHVIMKLVVAGAALGVALCAAPAAAKLPPPSPAEEAAKAAQRVREEARLAEEKALLERAQDRVAERYRRERAAAPSGGGEVRAGDLPNPVKQTEAPPEGGRKQSAEAHSATAK